MFHIETSITLVRSSNLNELMTNHIMSRLYNSIYLGFTHNILSLLRVATENQYVTKVNIVRFRIDVRHILNNYLVNPTDTNFLLAILYQSRESDLAI